MSTHRVIEQFYQCFQNKDWKGMQSCYHHDVVFSDPVFPNLHGKQAMAMWHMLVSAGKDLRLTFTDVAATDQTGSCHWEALYTFSRTGRQVHNVIDAKFEFSGDKIIRHNDHFHLWRWSQMALGTSGALLGWTPWLSNKIRATAALNLRQFISTHPEYQ